MLLVAIDYQAVTTIAVTFIGKKEDIMRTYGNVEYKVLFIAREGCILFG
jgi:hypothetical protein